MGRKKKIRNRLKKSIATAILFCLLAGIGTLPAADVLAAVKPTGNTYTYKTRTLTVRRGKKKIYSKIFIPVSGSKKKKFPTVIYSHGFGGNYEVGEPYARELAKKGYAAYCFDFCGGSPDSRSSGSTLEMSVFTEQKDLEAVIQKIKKQPYVDRKNIFLFGTSMGGVVSAITAAEHKKEIRGLILFYPAFVLVDDAKKLYAHEDEIPEKSFYLWMDVGKTYFKDLLDYDAYAQIKKYKRKVLIVHGDEDDIVPLSYSRKAVKTYSSAALKVIKGAGHGFDGKDEDRAVRYMLSYLNRQKK